MDDDLNSLCKWSVGGYEFISLYASTYILQICKKCAQVTDILTDKPTCSMLEKKNRKRRRELTDVLQSVSCANWRTLLVKDLLHPSVCNIMATASNTEPISEYQRYHIYITQWTQHMTFKIILSLGFDKLYILIIQVLKRVKNQIIP